MLNPHEISIFQKMFPQALLFQVHTQKKVACGDAVTWAKRSSRPHQKKVDNLNPATTVFVRRSDCFWIKRETKPTDKQPLLTNTDVQELTTAITSISLL